MSFLRESSGRAALPGTGADAGRHGEADPVTPAVPDETRDVQDLAAQADQVAQLLKALANDKRLLILCKLVEEPEMSVGALVDAVGISQPALSQHLARLREDGLVAFRREAQTLYYRCADARTAQLLLYLRELYCAPPVSSSGPAAAVVP